MLMFSRTVYNGFLIYTPDKLLAITQALNDWQRVIIAREKKGEEVKEAVAISLVMLPTGTVRLRRRGFVISVVFWFLLPALMTPRSRYSEVMGIWLEKKL